jgi:hypothetical protein
MTSREQQVQRVARDILIAARIVDLRRLAQDTAAITLAASIELHRELRELIDAPPGQR